MFSCKKWGLSESSVIRLRLFPARFRCLCRRGGYGVHAPFAYTFVKQVIEEDGSYYAYRALEKCHGTSRMFSGKRELKCRRFLFRLCNFVHPETVRLYGRIGEAERDYLLAAVPTATFEDGGKGEGSCRKTLYVVGAEEKAVVAKNIVADMRTDGSACVVFGIHGTREKEREWKFVSDMKHIVAFDVFYFGVLFYFTQKPHQYYAAYL